DRNGWTLAISIECCDNHDWMGACNFNDTAIKCRNIEHFQQFNLRKRIKVQRFWDEDSWILCRGCWGLLRSFRYWKLYLWQQHFSFWAFGSYFGLWVVDYKVFSEKLSYSFSLESEMYWSLFKKPKLLHFLV